MKKLIEWLFLRCGYVPEEDVRVARAVARQSVLRAQRAESEVNILVRDLARANAKAHPARPSEVPFILRQRRVG